MSQFPTQAAACDALHEAMGDVTRLAAALSSLSALIRAWDGGDVQSLPQFIQAMVSVIEIGGEEADRIAVALDECWLDFSEQTRKAGER